MLTEFTLKKFLNELSSNAPAPGGGSVAAAAGAMGAALTTMVCSLTIGKKKYADVESEMKDARQRAERLRERLSELINEDTDAFNRVMAALSFPKDTEEQKAKRLSAVQAATKEAALVPLEVMHLCMEGLELAKVAAEKGNVNSVSDAGVSTIMLYGALESAALNVQINLAALTDTAFVDQKSKQVLNLQQSAFPLLQSTLTTVRSKIRTS